MRKWKLVGAAAVGSLALAGAGLALAGDRAPDGLAEVGLKKYWSLLSEGQREQAKGIAADHLAATAPDRLAAQARLLRLASDVAAVLTIEQRKEVGRLRWVGKRLPREKRRELLQGLLDATDRAALADRLERTLAASPEERVKLGIEVLDQLYDAAEPRLAQKLGLSDEQRGRIRSLVGETKEDLRPVAVRLATAKADAVTKGLAILDATQREELDTFRAGVRARILDFVRGR